MIKSSACGLIALAAASLCTAAPAHAQQTELDTLRQQIQELQGRLEKLEGQQLTASDAAKAAPPVTSKIPIVISGLLQVQGLGELTDHSTPQNHADTFRLRRGEIRITAPAITNRISGTIMFDPAKSQNGAANNGVLQEIQLSYLLKKAKTNHFLDVGQFKVPIGYEGDLVSSSGLQTVERALMYQALSNDPAGGRGTDIRDTGMQLRGTVGQFDYRLAIFNGLGERQNALSTSDNKALVARLVYKPTGKLNGLQLGVSGGTDHSRSVAIAAPALAAQTLKRKVQNAFAVYKNDKWTLQSEYLKGDFNTIQGGLVRDRKGYYGSVGYLFTPKIEGVFRYDKFDTDDATPNTDTKEITAGVNYYIKGNNAKIQTNIVRVTPPTTGGASNARTELRTNFQVAF